jgi:hypothetical protein
VALGVSPDGERLRRRARMAIAVSSSVKDGIPGVSGVRQWLTEGPLLGASG